LASHVSKAIQRVLAAAGLLASAALGAPAAGAAEQRIDGVAAQVGSNIVLISEVEELAAPLVEKMKAADVPEAEVNMLRKDILERLIESRLIEEVVRQVDLTASDAEIDGAIQTIASESGLTVDQLIRTVNSHGISYSDYRGKIKAEIERNKVIGTMVRSRVRVEDKEVRALYSSRFSSQPSGGEEVHLRHILVAFGGTTMRDQATACRTIEDAIVSISNGDATFETTARRISDANPERGGDLGWIHSKDMAGWMAPSVKQLEVPGSLSGVIEMPFGCNLLQLVERRTFEPMSLEEATPQLQNEIFRQKTEAEYVKWVEKLRQQTYIERKGAYAASTSLIGP
jgi:peptidyl-prolyl cis-trans isomerase SurA